MKVATLLAASAAVASGITFNIQVDPADFDSFSVNTGSVNTGSTVNTGGIDYSTPYALSDLNAPVFAFVNTALGVTGVGSLTK